MKNEALQGWFGSHAKTLVEAWFPLWAENVRQNGVRGHIREDRSLHKLAGMFDSSKCVLAGPGPSLDLAIPWLKSDPHNVVACHSSLNPLLGNGVHPILTVACDAQESLGEKFAEVSHLINDTDILVCPVTIHPSVIENWPGQIALYVTHDPSPEYAAVDCVVNAALASHGLSKESLGFLTAGGCVGCAALEATFMAGFRNIKVVGYELGAMPVGHYYGQRFDFSGTTPTPVVVDGDEWDQPRIMYHKGQSDKYRLAFEQRLRWMLEQDPHFTWSNLSPYSFIQGNRQEIPAVELAGDLAGVS